MDLLVASKTEIENFDIFNSNVRSLIRRRTDIWDVGESTLTVGEQTVGETTRRRNDRNSFTAGPSSDKRARLFKVSSR